MKRRFEQPNGFKFDFVVVTSRILFFFFFFSSRRRHTRSDRDWSSDVCSSDLIYSNSDIGAAVSSGSFRTHGMIIAPCSIRTLSDIAYGGTDNLLSRAADVQDRKSVV